MNDTEERLAAALIHILRPLARLLVRYGVSYPEFETVAKAAFVETATKDFGRRGRPANASRVASITGLSRKEVSRIREIGATLSWFPESHFSPVNRVIHFWMHDREYSDSPTLPKKLPLHGERSFSTLVRKYAGDVPIGTLRSELELRGAMVVSDDDECNLLIRFVRFSNDREDLIQNILFSLRNLLETVEYNSQGKCVYGDEDQSADPDKRFERIVWSNRLNDEGAEAFKVWLERNGQSFLQDANAFISRHELSSVDEGETQHVVGVGMYFYDQSSR